MAIVPNLLTLLGLIDTVCVVVSWLSAKGVHEYLSTSHNVFVVFSLIFISNFTCRNSLIYLVNILYSNNT